jgi:hypothetical protein
VQTERLPMGVIRSPRGHPTSHSDGMRR